MSDCTCPSRGESPHSIDCRADCKCQQFLIDHMAAQGIEVSASPWHPGIVPTSYEPLNMRCPHGVKWHMEPTTDQIATWAREGIR